MNNNVEDRKYRELLTEANEVQRSLQVECSDNPIDVAQQIRETIVYMSRTGEMLAEAKLLLRRKKNSEIRSVIVDIAKEARLSATVQNSLLESICEKESYLVDRLDRINRSCTHKLDALRSLLSYERESLSLIIRGIKKWERVG